MSKQWGHGYHTGMRAALKIIQEEIDKTESKDKTDITQIELENIKRFVCGVFYKHSVSIWQMLCLANWTAKKRDIFITAMNGMEAVALRANKNIIDQVIGIVGNKENKEGLKITVYFNNRNMKYTGKQDALGRPIYEEVR